METRQRQWEASYVNRDNFVFYPHEEVVRFISKYIRKRVDMHEFVDVCAGGGGKRVLDVGCGIGRHVMCLHDMGLDGYGVDLAEEAVKVARQWAAEKGIDNPIERIVTGDASALPWPDGYFDFALSHGVLDSMYFGIAQAACREVGRILRPGGLFYCDLVSGDDSAHAREYAGEELVSTKHEQGTIQSYFNFGKLNDLFADSFEMVECNIIKNENVLVHSIVSRYHVVLARR